MFKWLFGEAEPQTQIVNGYRCRKVSVKNITIGDKLSSGKRVRGIEFNSVLEKAYVYLENQNYLTHISFDAYVWVVCEDQDEKAT